MSNTASHDDALLASQRFPTHEWFAELQKQLQEKKLHLKQKRKANRVKNKKAKQ